MVLWNRSEITSRFSSSGFPGATGSASAPPSMGTLAEPVAHKYEVGKLFRACSQRGIAATKEVVNAMVYNFSASCVEVERIESKWTGGQNHPVVGQAKSLTYEMHFSALPLSRANCEKVTSWRTGRKHEGR